MATNTIKTRIALKIDSLSAWMSSTLVPLNGEVCIAKVDTVEGSTLQPVMIKVGDNTHTFAELDWVSAKAADVYGWAKAKDVVLTGEADLLQVLTTIEGTVLDGFQSRRQNNFLQTGQVGESVSADLFDTLGKNYLSDSVVTDEPLL